LSAAVDGIKLGEAVALEVLQNLPPHQ
jgi:hypothetical protein